MTEEINVKIGLEIHVPELFSLSLGKKEKNVHEKEKENVNPEGGSGNLKQPFSFF